ncbi:MAG: RNA-binding transcriptional accessory protein [Desulfobacterales bacterium]|nr:RNA-binding transcriptional accessory protein [Desulfobacterales bacterium]
MNQLYISTICAELNLTESNVMAVAGLLAEDATVPFIARYRKEATGNLDEVAITSIRDRLAQLEELDNRKSAILKSLEENGHLTDELQESVSKAETLSVLEDIYLPYRPKRRTKATIAKEKGLEPLAEIIFEQTGINPEVAANEYIDAEKGVNTAEDALSGSRDIIAEIINENGDARAKLRELYATKSVVRSSVVSDKEEEGAKFKDYFDWSEPVTSVPSHRILAMRRGEKEDILNLSIVPEEEDAIKILEALFIKGAGEDSQQVRLAISDCYKRLLSRSMETEIRLTTKEAADITAIKIFAENLRELLMASPLGAKAIMGIDPGFRTGCKVVCLDRQGKFLHYETIFPHMSDAKTTDAGHMVNKLCEKFEIEAIAVGNGTAGRETETFVREILIKDIPVVMVNESGASIYSASEVARDEFPDLDLTVRGSISIGRRLMDPLSELVKIDAKSIGVGQYQHDVDQTLLKQSLDDVVESCVNGVGVDVNRASVQLLTYVSGLGPALAKKILTYRNENGRFNSRDDLKNVPRLGAKAFEQCAGFLRINNSGNPLDGSAVHPESYHIVYAMAKDIGCDVTDLMADSKLRSRIDLSKYVTDKVGLPTLNDIIGELAKPGRDPRKAFEEFAFEQGINKITDLEPGLKLPGIITNVTAFGAFVDVGVHQDGLVHISELADGFVKNPADVVKVQQQVSVTVLEVDIKRNRISLSMKSGAPAPKKEPQKARPKTNRGRKQNKPMDKAKGKPASKKDVPFNNPFAELFGKN